MNLFSYKTKFILINILLQIRKEINNLTSWKLTKKLKLGWDVLNAFIVKKNKQKIEMWPYLDCHLVFFHGKLYGIYFTASNYIFKNFKGIAFLCTEISLK